ncbi:PEGA domain-containing protein [candidate division KSB1 bacterium]|nr:PEGA domain-containing protein [candidate division KSB1 bacterium]
MKKNQCTIFMYFILIGIIGFPIDLVYTQSTETPGNVSIKSNPVGTLVYFNGSRDLVCQAPCQITHGLHGLYRIEAVKSGYESWKSVAFFNLGETRALAINLVPKKRIKAGMRSLLVPGWGQLYSERPLKAAIWGSLFMGSLGAAVVSDVQYDSKNNAYQELQEQLKNSSLSDADRLALANQIHDKENEMDDIDAFRKGAQWTCIAVWALNLADALINYPNFYTHLTKQEKSFFSATSVNGITRISFSTTF